MEDRDPGEMPRSDSGQLADFWRAVVAGGDVHEVRAPRTRRTGPRRWRGTVSGYFDNEDDFVDALEGADGRDAEGVYLTLNPVNPALLARAANHLALDSRVTTTDADVVRRRHVLVDVDPGRPTGISATDAEQAAALAVRDAIDETLLDLGWPPAVLTMESGNGGALVYRVDLPNDPDAHRLVTQLLKGLGAAFDTPAVTIDTSTHNAARLLKVAGTVAAKGDHFGDRPWRTARAVCDAAAGIVSREQLEAVAAWGEEAEAQPTPIRPGVGRWERRDIRAALQAAGVGFRERAKSYGTVFELDRCLTSADHDDGAVVIEMASGALAYRCLHNRCAGKSWADVREQLGFEPGGDPGPRITIGGVDPTTGERVGGDQDPEEEPAAAGPQAPPADEDVDQLAVVYPEPPPEAFQGWFGDYHQLVEPTTEAADAFHLGVALVIVGAMIGRTVAVNYGNPLHANLNGVLVGPSGYSRKDTAIRRGLRMTDMQLTALAGGRFYERAFQVIYNVSSAEGLITDLQANDNTLIYLSEFSSLIRNARRKSTTTILPLLMQAYDGMPLQNNTKHAANRRSVDAPCLSLIAATQPDILAADMTGEDISSGFANRAMWFPGHGKEGRPRPPELDKQAAWSLYEQLWLRISAEYPAGTVLPVSPDADEIWQAWYQADRARMGKDADEDSMRVRHGEFIHKVALMYAVVQGHREIRPCHLEPAIAVMDWQWRAVKVLMTEWGKGLNSIIEGRIRAVLVKYGPQEKRFVHMRCRDRRWSSVEFNSVFKALKESGVVIETAGVVSLAGRR